MRVPTTISPGPRSTDLERLDQEIESHPIWTELRGPVNRTLDRFAEVLAQFGETVERVDGVVDRVGAITDEMGAVVSQLADVVSTLGPAFALNDVVRRQLGRVRGKGNTDDV